jgi:hypothetical protein
MTASAFGVEDIRLAKKIDVSTDERRDLELRGHARPGGRFPVPDDPSKAHRALQSIRHLAGKAKSADKPYLRREFARWGETPPPSLSKADDLPSIRPPDYDYPSDNRKARRARSREKAGLATAGVGALIASRGKEMAPGTVGLVTRNPGKKLTAVEHEAKLARRAAKFEGAAGKAGAVLAAGGLLTAGVGLAQDWHARGVIPRAQKKIRNQLQGSNVPMVKSAFGVEDVRLSKGAGKVTNKVLDTLIDVGERHPNLAPAAGVLAGAAAGTAVGGEIDRRRANRLGAQVSPREYWGHPFKSGKKIHATRLEAEYHGRARQNVWGNLVPVNKGVGEAILWHPLTPVAATAAGGVAGLEIGRRVGNRYGADISPGQMARHPIQSGKKVRRTLVAAEYEGRARRNKAGFLVPVQKAFDPEGQRHRRQNLYSGAATGGAVIGASGAVGLGVASRKKHIQGATELAESEAINSELTRRHGVMTTAHDPGSKMDAARRARALRPATHAGNIRLHEAALKAGADSRKTLTTARRLRGGAVGAGVTAAALGATAVGVHRRERGPGATYVY